MASTKALVVYYTRTGTTRLLAEAIQQASGADLEEIVDPKKRSGVLGYLASGRDAWRKKTADIQVASKEPADYDVLIIGTPVWAFTMTPAVRTFLERHRGKLRKVAFFCTMGGSGDKGAFAAMEEVAGMKPAAVLACKEKDVRGGVCAEAVTGFVKAIQGGS
jgi:flavodoxin